jgi:hypothetical protein
MPCFGVGVFPLVLTARAVYAVLRGRCLSVDEPILGSTPALTIPGSLVTPTPKHSLINGVVITIDIRLV